VSKPEHILTIEEEKASEFAKRLDVEVSDRLEVAEPSDDQIQAAFAEVAGAYIVQDGGMPEFIPCSINGDKPADLPVQVPVKFEVAVNVKTAKALGLTVPTSIVVRAEEVID
jgi:hypothetical protein